MGQFQLLSNNQKLMKNRTKIIPVALLFVSGVLSCSICLAQGDLTPPGAPAPTMKSLSQVEPRTPISNLPYTIHSSGSYYLTTNLEATSGDAIHVSSSSVTLDLNGFTISSTTPDNAYGGAGILVDNGLRDITVVNGHIQSGFTNNGSGVYAGSGFNYGIYCSGKSANVRVRGVSVSGVLYYGILLSSSDSTLVESCTVRTTGNYGITASVIKNCTAMDCGGAAIDGNVVSDSVGQSSGGYGVYATSEAVNCSGTSSTYEGLSAKLAENCFGSSTSDYGLGATTAENCYGQSSNYYGLSASSAQNSYGASTGSGTGIYATSAINCYGYSRNSYGIHTQMAQNCEGWSDGTNSYGLYATFTATGCYGYTFTGTGLYAFIANVCHGMAGGVGGTALSSPHNINSF